MVGGGIILIFQQGAYFSFTSFCCSLLGRQNRLIASHFTLCISTCQFNPSSRPIYNKKMIRRNLKPITAVFLAIVACSSAFTPSPLFTRRTASISRLEAVESKNKGGPYEPKWVKKSTLAEEAGSIKDLGFDKVGLKGTIPVVFRQGNETRQSMAWSGQPLREVAIQAGQFIKYGCGKGECGTCECMVNGRWIRPCIATVPAMAAGEELIVQVKAMHMKKVSSDSCKISKFTSSYEPGIAKCSHTDRYKRIRKQ